ncbi:MAG: hypothetical protein QOI41_80, partial [Myxococcales bacterium]|nr:hypothetical protein [Myxococcales bacterium]
RYALVGARAGGAERDELEMPSVYASLHGVIDATSFARARGWSPGKKWCATRCNVGAGRAERSKVPLRLSVRE